MIPQTNWRMIDALLRVFDGNPLVHFAGLLYKQINSLTHGGGQDVPCCPGLDVSYTSNTMVAIMK
jgi:hypothetical protein